MGLLQAAYRTYENHAARAGVSEEGQEALLPLSHMVMKAQLEVSIAPEGVIQSARRVDKQEANTLIPATMKSANRVGDNDCAHPLSDQLRYLAPFGGTKFSAYVEQLTEWAESEYTHPKVRAILDYIRKETLLDDLAAAGLITLKENGSLGDGKIEGNPYEKCVVRWRVIPETEGTCSACWEDASLFKSFSDYYDCKCKEIDRALCMITGQEDIMCEAHPKGTVRISHGAKLISANDSSGYTFRGRFTEARQAVSVGYTASQKAHSALRWIAVNQGVIQGGRTFLCWNPEGKTVPASAIFGLKSEKTADFVSYRRKLLQTIGGYRQALADTDDVVVATLQAATTGRLSVTYYNELKAPDFWERITHWYETSCWPTDGFGLQSPPLKQIVDYSFGTQRDSWMETDERALGEHIQRLLHCLVDRQPVPTDMVRALTTRAGNLQIYKGNMRERLLSTACAMIRKNRTDTKKEEWTLALDTTNTDRSYLFGRLLAVAEQVERSTYDFGEERETNAIRLQSVFTQRPLYAWRLIEEKLAPYFARLAPPLRHYFKSMIGDIADKLPPVDNSDLTKRLDDVYLLGYYHQRAAMTRKKETGNDSQDITKAEGNEE